MASSSFATVPSEGSVPVSEIIIYTKDEAVSPETSVPSSEVTKAPGNSPVQPDCHSNLSTLPDALRLTVVDPVTSSFSLYSLITMQDKMLEQVQFVDDYILDLTEKIVRGARKNGRVHGGLLLLTRKCVAEGIRRVLMLLAMRKHRQVLQCYNFIRHTIEGQDGQLRTSELDNSHDHEVTKIARGLSMECCAFQRSS